MSFKIGEETGKELLDDHIACTQLRQQIHKNVGDGDAAADGEEFSVA